MQAQNKTQADDQRLQKIEQINAKFESAKNNVYQQQEEKEKEYVLKRELRRLREEEIKKINERKKNQ